MSDVILGPSAHIKGDAIIVGADIEASPRHPLTCLLGGDQETDLVATVELGGQKTMQHIAAADGDVFHARSGACCGRWSGWRGVIA